MAEKENFLKARLTKWQAEVLEKIVEEIQAKTPEANVTTSSIARYALEKYIREYEAKKNGTKMFIEINTSDATEEDIIKLDRYVAEMEQKAIEAGDEKVSSMISSISFSTLIRRTEIMKKKRGH